MLSLFKISNVALIEELEAEFARGLNLLTGETGSGKSIIVDALGVLTGGRASADLIKQGADEAKIEGIFHAKIERRARQLFEEAGIEIESAGETELIVRREISTAGRNRIFVNDRLVTQGLLKKLGPLLVDIHGQGEQQTLFGIDTHREMLDEFSGAAKERASVAEKFAAWESVKKELDDLRADEAQKLQLLDILRFQANEIGAANLQPGEEEELEEEKRRLNNVEKLSSLSDDAYAALYENSESTLATLEKANRRVLELSDFDSRFGEYVEGLTDAQATLEDLATELRDFRNRLEFSPARLEEIENRLAEITRLKRKYGGSIAAVLAHFAESQERLNRIETSELREKELEKHLAAACGEYMAAAGALHEKRVKAARKFEKETLAGFAQVALEKAKLEVSITAPNDLENADAEFTSHGYDRIEFLFSANPGESVKPIAKVASGGEASRLMLILKTVAKEKAGAGTAVFDEIDAGIGGRVAEAVGLKLKELAAGRQILCVTHQAQVASQADHHFVVEKETLGNKTSIHLDKLTEKQRVEEIARMLAGASISDTARKHAKEMIAAQKT